MKENKQLILNISHLRKKSDTFYRKMDNSLTYREKFLRDPVKIISKDLLEITCEKESIRISKTNHLLFALLSNKKFMEWVEQFEREVQSKVNNAITSDDPKVAELELASYLNRTYYYREIVQAMFECLDVETFEALLNLNRETGDISSSNPNIGFNVRYEKPDQISISLDPTSLAEQVFDDSTVVCVAIAIYAVAAIAVFGVAVAAVALAEGPGLLSRADLQRISNFMTKELTQRAHLLRKEAELKINFPKRNAIFDGDNE
ncbi:hypothetical protein [Bacillus toyonensis]|uniref:hypothetical protein n=1 Tax=Bacillus toyonensis TaxID=155322 RepID=UPI003D215473